MLVVMGEKSNTSKEHMNTESTPDILPPASVESPAVTIYGCLHLPPFHPPIGPATLAMDSREQLGDKVRDLNRNGFFLQSFPVLLQGGG